MPALEDFTFCPRCAQRLVERELDGKMRRLCEREGCGFVAWGNPTPVVAALVEHEGQVLLVRGRNWPPKMFGLVTGFLEAGESPEAGVLREVREELGLEGSVVELIGNYPFEMKNEVLLAYHVRATGSVRLGLELEAHKPLPPEKLKPWPFGTGLAVAEWLARRGSPRP